MIHGRRGVYFRPYFTDTDPTKAFGPIFNQHEFEQMDQVETTNKTNRTPQQRNINRMETTITINEALASNTQHNYKQPIPKTETATTPKPLSKAHDMRYPGRKLLAPSLNGELEKSD